MKAKEYFRKYVDDNQDEKDKMLLVANTFLKIFKEVKEIQLMRRARSNSAMISIMNEQNIKANSFIRKVNEIDGLGLKQDSFKLFIKIEMPELYKSLGWD